jgi:hypothetical protein
MPKGSKRIRPVKVVMEVGEAIYPPARETARVSRRSVSELTATLGVRLQELFDDALAAAGRAGESPQG